MKQFLKVAVLIVLLSLLSIRIASSKRPDDHESVFTREGLLTADAGQLKSTVVTPHLEAPIEPGRNVLWCSTFQLAWNEVCALIGEDVHFRKDPPMVAVLNKKAATKKDLDEASYVALAGFVRDGIYEKIPRALERKFKGKARPQLLPVPELAPRPQDIVAYAYLFKHLEFSEPFERLEEALVFNETRVSCFGIGADYKPGHQRMYPQVRILYYEGPDNFAVELKTKSEGDRLVLAKMEPAATLGETVVRADRQIASSEPAETVVGDVLKVPKFNFDLTRTYGELLEHRLVVKNPEVAKDLMVFAALQNIRFQMDEKGVRLRSESTLQFGCAAAHRPRPQHIMIFDEPFLILLRRADADVPYFALWVDNSELLVPFD